MKKVIVNQFFIVNVLELLACYLRKNRQNNCKIEPARVLAFDLKQLA